jgi:hypothetical protein
MIKKIIFSLALLTLTVAPLTPHLAYGQNPSTSFSDQVVPAGSDPTPPPTGGSDPTPCDIGPPYTGQIPNGAQVAGYTHCLMNLDFTQTASFTNSGVSYNWATLSTWLNCAGASSPILWLNPTDVACDSTHISVVQDGSVQVLRLQILPTDYSGSQVTQLVSYKVAGTRQIQGISVPQGNFVEEVSRVSTASIGTCVGGGTAGCPGLLWAPFYYGMNAGGSDAFLEEDFWEANDGPNPRPHNTASSWDNPSGSGPGLSPPNQITTNQDSYNTMGVLWTGDGSANSAVCGYTGTGNIQGLGHSNLVSCGTGGWQIPTSGNQWSRTGLYLTLGPEYHPGETLSGTQTIFIQRETIWVCPSGGQPTGGATYGNQCIVSPVLSNSPPL